MELGLPIESKSTDQLILHQLYMTIAYSTHSHAILWLIDCVNGQALAHKEKSPVTNVGREVSTGL